MYKKTKQEKASGKRPKDQEIKTVKVGFKTGPHDLEFKEKQIGEFLREGHIVRIELTLRGREKGLAEMGRTKLTAFLTTIKEGHTVQDAIKRSPFGWSAIIKK